jgi:outer membrane protein OmpA-like peptidoglycan-associated protein
MADPVAYKPGGVKVAPGAPLAVQLPSQLVRTRLTGMLFEIDKAFLLPSAIPGMRRLTKVYESFKVLRVLVNGHASRTGNPEHNRVLSEERARSVAAYLQDAVDVWLPFYDASLPEKKRWGPHEDGLMLATLGFADITSFQASKSELAADGVAGPLTRHALVEAYMKQPETSLPSNATVVTHGCGEFHPEIETAEGVEEEKNRRVEVYFFEGEVLPPPQAKCPDPGCLEYPQWKANATQTIDLSQPGTDLTIEVRNKLNQAIPDANVKLSGPLPAEGKTDASGLARFEDLVAGKYLISAEREGFDTVISEVEV